MADILRIQQLSVWYQGESPIISNLDLQLPAHRVIGLVGKNGAGKTTLLHTMSGLIDKQHYQVDNVAFNEKAVDFADTQYKLQRYLVLTENNSFSNWNFEQYFSFVCALYHRKRDEALLNQLIDGFSFRPYLKMSIASLSTGNKKKVFLITGFYLRCPLLLLDEPIDGLDFEATEFLYQAIKDYKVAGTVLLSSHIIESIGRVCDQLLVLEKGRLEKVSGSPATWVEQLLAKAGDTYALSNDT